MNNGVRRTKSLKNIKAKVRSYEKSCYRLCRGTKFEISIYLVTDETFRFPSTKSEYYIQPNVVTIMQCIFFYPKNRGMNDW